MEPYLERIDKKGVPHVRLPVGMSSIGRYPGNNIALSSADKCVSGYHAIINVEPKRLLLQDLDSTNGTFVNGQRVNERVLAEGDEIGLGQSGPRFRVVFGADGGNGIDKISPGVDVPMSVISADENNDCDDIAAPGSSPKRFGVPVIIPAVALAVLVLLMTFIFRSVASGNRGTYPPPKKNFFSSPAVSSDIPLDDYDILFGITPSRADAAASQSSVESRINAILRRFGETDYRMPAEMVERVDYYLKRYSGSMKRTISNYMARRDTYFPMIRRVFAEKNIPFDLAYVSMLESGLDPNALSHAGAKGLWQFMPLTARRYGLEVSAQRDDRADPEKATYAAAAYFKDLIAVFGAKSAVMLCMAAYNAGETRVINALKRIDDPVQNRDFWYLYRRGWLAEETNEYIPQVIALIIISENPEEYGFER